MKKRAAHPRHLDIDAFCRSAGLLAGETDLADFERLRPDEEPDGTAEHREAEPVHWEAQGQWREARAGQPDTGPWLHLTATANVPQTCQRCLQPMLTEVSIERWFRFVDNEALAAEMDEDSEDDVLVASRNFNLLELVEDELLMEMPLVPMHDACDVVSPASMPGNREEAISGDSATAEEPSRPHPFAVLQALEGRVRKGE